MTNDDPWDDLLCGSNRGGNVAVTMTADESFNAPLLRGSMRQGERGGGGVGPEAHLVEAEEVLDGGRCVEDHPVGHHGQHKTV